MTHQQFTALEALEHEMSKALQSGALFNPNEFDWQQQGQHIILAWTEQLRAVLNDMHGTVVG